MRKRKISKPATEHPVQQAVDKEEVIQKMVDNSPVSSVHRISQQTHMPQTRVWKTLNHHDWYPFYEQIFLTPQPDVYPA
jgi:hypothetical protein